MRLAVPSKTTWETLILTIALLYIMVPALSQENTAFGRKVDSLKALLSFRTGLAKQEVFFQLGYEYLRVNDSIALPYATEAFNMSWQLSDSLTIVKSGRARAMILYELSKHDSVVALSTMLLPIARRNKYVTETKYLLNLLGLAHTHKAEYDKALTYNFESLEMRKKYDDDLSVSIALNNIGLVYYKIEDFVQALHYFEKSLKLKDASLERSRKLGKDILASTIFNISLCYAYMDNLTKAREYLERGTKFCGGSCSDRILVLMNFASGVFHFNSGNLNNASEAFLHSLFFAKGLSDRRSQLDNLLYLSKISIASKNIVGAEKYLLEAEPFFETDTPFRAELAEVYSQLSHVYTKSQNYRKAGLYQSKYIDLSAKVYTRQLTVNLMKVQAEYLERENKAKIQAQEKILVLNQDVITRQRALNIVVAAVAILSIAFVVVLGQNIRQKKRANILLEQRVQERTMELENKHDMLVKSLYERDIEVQRITNDIKSSLATIRGLGSLVLHDVSMIKTSEYVEKIEQTSNNLLQGLSFGKSHSTGK